MNFYSEELVAGLYDAAMRSTEGDDIAEDVNDILDHFESD